MMAPPFWTSALVGFVTGIVTSRCGFSWLTPQHWVISITTLAVFVFGYWIGRR